MECLTCGRVSVDKILASSISVVVVNRGDGPVDGQLLKVGPSVTVQLGIKVRKDASLQQRVFGEVDSTHDVSGLKLD